MHPVRDDLRSHMRTVRYSTDNTRIPVGKGRHRVEEMYRMASSGIIGLLCSLIVCICMGERDTREFLHLLNIIDEIRIILRCKSDELQKSPGGLVEFAGQVRVARDYIVRVLCTLFHFADKGPFHIDADDVRAPVPVSHFSPLHPVTEFRHIGKDRLELVRRQGQRRRADRRDA